MGVELFVRPEEPPGLLHLTAPNSVPHGPEDNITRLKLETNVAFANGQNSTPDFFNVALILVTGLFLPLLNSTILVMFVELNGTLSPAPAIGLLRRLLLPMLAARASTLPASAAPVRRSRSVCGPSGA